MNNFLLICGYATLIAGPLLALFDHTVKHRTPDEKIGEQVHQYFTNIFVAGQVLYLFIMISIFDNHTEEFPNTSGRRACLRMIRLTVTLFFIWQQYCDYYDIPGAWWSYVEWYAFLNTFGIYMIIATMMPFKNTFYPEKQE